MSQKYVIVHFIDKANTPQEFPASEWPLHVTLLANFTLGKPIEQLEKELADYVQHAKPFDIMADGEAFFGPKQNVHVSLIKPNDEIIAMHNTLAAITKQLDAVYDEPAFMGEGYRPHATIQAKARLADKQSVPLDDITLVDMYPDENINRRRIIKTFALDGK